MTRSEILYFPLVIIGLLAVLIGGFELMYAGSVYPGVSANGAYLGGLSLDEAVTATEKRTKPYLNQKIAVVSGEKRVEIPVEKLELRYDSAEAARQAYEYGRRGGLWQRASEQAQALIGQETAVAAYSFSDARLSEFLLPIIDQAVTPVANASLKVEGKAVSVVPSRPGQRLDIGRLVGSVQDRLSTASSGEVTALLYGLSPTVTTASLEATKSQADNYLAEPLVLSYGETERQIEPVTIAKWLTVKPKESPVSIIPVYALPPSATIELDQDAVEAYVIAMAKSIDRKPQDAALTIQDGKATVFRTSQDGQKLDRTAAIKDITAGVKAEGDARRVKLAVAVVKPAIYENNLNDLGIKELISEGVTYFPGSSADRMTNVRTGASKFNGMILKPGEVFSFVSGMGDVSAAGGYVPELVILGNRKEKQYGGGLCQVSSTAYRAALLAGLPIVERHNHSYAISYYTQPYAAPGVDATIYDERVDFKFRNDTGSHILIQTVMQGTSLKFQFYGTKTKSGVIRGPNFIAGSNDHTKPSHTVFYRDVLDLNGKVIKTDATHTWYQSSTKFKLVD